VLKTDGMISRFFPLEETQQAMEELAATSEPVRYVLEPKSSKKEGGNI